MKKILLSLIFSTLFTSFFYCQTLLKSSEESYLDYLFLTGQANRPTLNFRSLSDNKWENINSENPFSFYILGPEWYNSFNTSAPYGQNDGLLWQGRGYNTVLSGGIRFESYGFELTLKPEIAFSQNLNFDFVTPAYINHAGFEGKGSDYGYYGIKYIDAPQRFGNKPLFSFGFGESELRYTWNNLTLGFGTQSIWIGPAEVNPIIHSNNAPNYPKFDLGLRKTNITLPWKNINLGNFEARSWWGKLSESDFFDNAPSNDHNLITAFAFAWEPSFLSGFSIGINRNMLSKWNQLNAYSLFHIYWPFIDSTAGLDENDQRFSLTLDYSLPAAGFEIFLEWARNDYSPNIEYVIRYPFHTQGWTGGFKKTINFSENVKGKLLLELTHLEASADYYELLNWSTTFYAHHKITQGYTNKGQWLGAGLGTGGNSQFLGLNLYYDKGDNLIFFQRTNPDLDYTMFIDSKKEPSQAEGHSAQANIRTTLSLGITGNYFIFKELKIHYGVIITDDMNFQNISNENSASKHRINGTFVAGIKYYF